MPLYREEYLILRILKNDSQPVSELYSCVSSVSHAELHSILQSMMHEGWIHIDYQNDIGYPRDKSICYITRIGRAALSSRAKNIAFEIVQILTFLAAILPLGVSLVRFLLHLP